MGERPILFSAPMVQAILANRKTVTRRIIKPQPPTFIPRIACGWMDCGKEPHVQRYGFWNEDNDFPCPYGGPGDRLWVRETWKVQRGSWCGDVVYRADGATIPMEFTEVMQIDGKHFDCPKWRPSIFMPRWASRITLELRSVRAERLHDITEEDVKLEGFGPGFVPCPSPRDPAIYTTRNVGYLPLFRRKWNELNAKRGFPWESNPWAWRIEFKRLEVPRG